jgi:hypothetical protein
MSQVSPKELTDISWIDLESATIGVLIGDRITVTLYIDEFMDFFDSISDIKSALEAESKISIGTYEKDGNTYKQFMIVPDDDDFN